MPFGGPRLPQNTIDIIIQWEADGLLEELILKFITMKKILLLLVLVCHECYCPK